MTDALIGTKITAASDILTSQYLWLYASKPTSRLNEPYLSESVGSLNSRNAILIELNQSFIGMGFWIGDVETRTDGQWTPAEIRLIDVNNNVVSTQIITTSTVDQSLCGNPANTGTGSDLYKGCGNTAGRYIGISNHQGNDIRKVLIVVGDDDSVTANDGNTEHLIMMGGYIMNCFPSPEVCNNKDDDCNDFVDEDLVYTPQSCTNGLGICLWTGTQTPSCIVGVETPWVCNAVAGTPATETCNNIDDDCDGQIDNDLTTLESCFGWIGACATKGLIYHTCQTGAMVASICDGIPGEPSLETCNDIDDNCNGETDEGLFLWVSCGVWACQASGTEQCISGIWTGNSCTAGAAGIETCNGIDDNCNETIDEGLENIQKSCSLGAWTCLSTWYSLESCISWSLLEIQSCNAMSLLWWEEICNGLDDDCDGNIDEIPLPQVSSCSIGLGICSSTGTITTSCISGSMETISCTAIIKTPFLEVCNGLDDDCDGEIDEWIAAVDLSCSSWTWVCMMTGSLQSICQSGIYIYTTCNAVSGTGTAEICNTLDDDCDGTIDEGNICTPPSSEKTITTTGDTQTGSTNTWTVTTGSNNTGNDLITTGTLSTGLVISTGVTTTESIISSSSSTTSRSSGGGNGSSYIYTIPLPLATVASTWAVISTPKVPLLITVTPTKSYISPLTSHITVDTPWVSSMKLPALLPRTGVR
jgi:Putative metal-binding motif